MSGAVYFIQAGDDGPVKVGYSTDPYSRLKTLQTSHYKALHLRGFAQGDELTEHRLHRELNAHRLKGEWFAPHGDVFAKIETRFADLAPTTVVLKAAAVNSALAVKALEVGDVREAISRLVMLNAGVVTTLVLLGATGDEAGELNPLAKEVLRKLLDDADAAKEIAA